MTNTATEDADQSAVSQRQLFSASFPNLAPSDRSAGLYTSETGPIIRPNADNAQTDRADHKPTSSETPRICKQWKWESGPGSCVQWITVRGPLRVMFLVFILRIRSEAARPKKKVSHQIFTTDSRSGCFLLLHTLTKQISENHHK